MLKQRFPIYPFLFILYVVANPVVNNLGEINPDKAVRPLVVLFLLAAAVLFLFRVIVKNWHYASYLTFLLLFGFFAFGHIHNILVEKLPEEHVDIYPLALLAILGILVVVLGLRKTWNRMGGSGRITPMFNFILTVALLSQGLFTVKEVLAQPSSSESQLDPAAFLADTGIGGSEATTDTALDCSISPDIYWIVLDGYGRADVLADMYGVDTSPFLDSLENKGFYIADESHSNYIQTVYSIPSGINFSYLDPMPANVSGYDYFPELLQQNQLVDLLEQCDYKTVAFQTGFHFTHYPGADVFYKYGTDLNELEGLLLADTPLDMLLDRLDLKPAERTYETHRARVHFTFDRLAELPELSGPKFVFAHIISPHPPFVFDAQGNPVQPRRGYSLVDGNDYRGSWAEYRRGYVGQVQYVNQLVEQTVSSIINRSSAQPVIIIQGDHGPGSHLQWKSADRTCLWERASILNAYYLPNGGSSGLYPTISPVNSFRVVLNTYFGTNFNLLPDETYFTSAQLGAEFIDVTARRDSKANCE